MRLLFNHTNGSYDADVTFYDKKTKANFTRRMPQALLDYRIYARGVDIVNQLHYSYIIGRKSHSSWSRLVWWLIELCILNAYYLWRLKDRNRTQLQFRTALMHELTQSTDSSRVISQRPRSCKRQRASASLSHISQVLTVARACHNESCTVRALKSCIQCSESASKPVHLCSIKCWNAFHSSADLMTDAS